MMKAIGCWHQALRGPGPAHVLGPVALWGALLLGISAATAGGCAVHQLRALAQQEAQGRAQLVADALAAHVQRAVALGVPLRRLEGVEALFAQHMQALPNIAAVALTDADHEVLALVELVHLESFAWALTDTRHEVLARRSLSGAQALPSGPRAVSPVSAGGAPVASVVLVWRAPGAGSLLGPWLAPLAALVAAVAALAREALRYSLARGLHYREALVQAACARIEAGDFSGRLPPLQRHDFDPRTTWLSAELRHLNEQHLRVSRLAQSLRRTEPEAARRAGLDATRLRATGAEHFRSEPGAGPLDVAGPAEAAGRWRGILLGTAVWAAGVAAALLAAQPMAPPRVWPFTIAALALLALGARQAGLRGQGRAWLTGGLVGLLILGPGLVLPILRVLAPQPLSGLALASDLLSAWAALGSLALLLPGTRCVPGGRAGRRAEPAVAEAARAP